MEKGIIDSIAIKKYSSMYSEVYEADGTVYLFNKKPLSKPNEAARRIMNLKTDHMLHNQTSTFREWAAEYNIPTPRDKKDLYCYVITIDDTPLPTVWPSLNYLRTHKVVTPSSLNVLYAPKVVYPVGTRSMCRFGHIKKRDKTGRTHCYRCAWWRQQGVDLSAYKPTHCLEGHPLKDNRWLIHRSGRNSNSSVAVKESCVKCHNELVMKKYGYTPHN